MEMGKNWKAEGDYFQDKDSEHPTRDQALEMWAKCDLWPLESAIELLISPLTFLPGESRLHELSEIEQHKFQVMHEIALNCAASSLPIVTHKTRPEIPHVAPDQFIDWADSHSIQIPSDLLTVVFWVRKRLKDRSPAHERALRPEQRHRLRCEGIAAYLWAQSDTKKLSIREMTERPEIIEIGCEKAIYTSETIRKWVKDEAPSHVPGRKPKEH